MYHGVNGAQIARWTKNILLRRIDRTLVRRFSAQFLHCPSKSANTAIPATLHANLRINKTLLNPRRYGDAEAEVEVFGQALR